MSDDGRPYNWQGQWDPSYAHPRNNPYAPAPTPGPDAAERRRFALLQAAVAFYGRTNTEYAERRISDAVSAAEAVLAEIEKREARKPTP
jgi:hypothetical protein